MIKNNMSFSGGKMASADLYFETIDFLRYLKRTDCGECGIKSCKEFINALIKKLKKPQDCPFLTKNEVYAFEIALKSKDLLPEVPLLTHPRPSLPGLVEVNKPRPDSVVLISGNNEYTEQVMMTILGTTTCSFFVIFADADGNTVDMAMVYRTLTSEKIHKALIESGIEVKSNKRDMIIPGFASSLKEEIEQLTGWQVQVGPICAAELPLFLSEIWATPE
jgi:CO dehydrogenase/acetyl-CoA synthase gamma subunit (corrinoid Fe-S protein)